MCIPVMSVSAPSMNQMQAPLSDHEIHQGQAKLKKLIESNLASYPCRVDFGC